MHVLSYSAARANLAATIDQAVNNHEAITITRGKREPVVMLALSDYQSMQETAYLLRNPHNAQHLLQSIAQIDAGQVQGKTMDELDAMAR